MTKNKHEAPIEERIADLEQDLSSTIHDLERLEEEFENLLEKLRSV
jgi:molecular chaperone GrpE (heat shock protein)